MKLVADSRIRANLTYSILQKNMCSINDYVEGELSLAGGLLTVTDDIFTGRPDLLQFSSFRGQGLKEGFKASREQTTARTDIAGAMSGLVQSRQYIV